MLVCSRYIPKVCSGAVCARLFTGSAGEEKTQEVVRKFIESREKESSLTDKMKATGISPLQAKISKLGKNIYDVAIIAAVSVASMGPGFATGTAAFDLLTALDFSDDVRVPVATGVAVATYIEVLSILLPRMSDDSLSDKQKAYNEAKKDIENLHADIGSLHAEAEGMAIGSRLPDLFD